MNGSPSATEAVEIIKVGGNELDEAGFVERLAQAVAARLGSVIIVHGGGKAIGDLQEKLGLAPKKVDGLRVTDAPSLAVAQMVLSGAVNKRIVQALLACGVQALGVSGVDAGLLRCQRKRYGTVDLGLVGEIGEVNTPALRRLLEAGFTPVISPISLGVDGAIYNVNADEAAGAIARALAAPKAWFVSNVDGVLDEERRLIAALTGEEALRLIESGAIRDGMVPKVRTAVDAVACGVAEVVITNIDGLQRGAGTRLIRSSS